MNVVSLVCNWSLFLLFVNDACAVFDPLSGYFSATAGTAALGAAMGYLYKALTSPTCNPPKDLPLLASYLSRVHGQHIATEQVLGAIKLHTSDIQPKHALSIVMVGGTGTGKNYMATAIAEYLFSDGAKSRYVQIFYPGSNFPESTKILYDTIKETVKLCKHSLFIFDEIDKMPSGVIDTIKPFLDFTPKVDDVDYRNTIFIFLANRGGSHVNTKYMQLRDRGLRRSEMEYKDFGNMLKYTLFDNEGLFSNSSIISQEVIGRFIPFLPMEKELVIECIKDEFSRQNFSEYTQNDVDSVLSHFEFYNEYCETGCKRVTDSVGVVVTSRKKELTW